MFRVMAQGLITVRKPYDRQDYLPLQDHREARRGRDGGGLQGRGSQAQALGRAEVPSALSVTRDPEARTVHHEARAASALDHNNICTIHEIDEVEGQTFIAMACIEGETLKDRIRRGPAPARRGARGRPADRGRPGRGPFQGHHPPGHQAR